MNIRDIDLPGREILTEEHYRRAEELLRDTRANGGLAPVDIERFWADNAKALRDPFSPDIAQPAFGNLWNYECAFDELGFPEDHWKYQNEDKWRVELNKAYNDKAERIIGLRPLNEKLADPDAPRFPPVKMLHDFFEARNVWHVNSWWLMPSANSESELEALLDRVEKRLENPRAFMLPANWDREKERLLALGAKPPRYTYQRGPVTFACSVFGPENLIMTLMLNPGLGGRFRDLILRAMLAIRGVLDEESGFTPETAPRGFGFADDNCCLLTPELYEFFGWPILKGVFDVCAPDPGDWRHQHSDSPMGHLLPLLAKFNLQAANFGPTLTCAEIRRHMPRTVIEGQLAPFTLSRNEEEKMVLEFLRDHAMTRERRGLKFSTAGSVNNGTRLSGIRLLMAAVQRYGQYD
jgi:uroporphyrinogen decarboxylase